MKNSSLKKFAIVVGLGRSGIGAAKLLKAKGENVTIIENKKNKLFVEKAKQLKHLGIKVRLNFPLEIKELQDDLNKISKVIVSPGIPWDHPTLNSLRQLDIKVISEISLACQNFSNIPLIGITGTNGKTTLTYLLQHVLQSNNILAPIGGNVGISACEIALELEKGLIKRPDWIILELSSFQIEASQEISPRIGVLTNITPDHLDRHGTFENYKSIKISLLKKSEFKFLNADDINSFNEGFTCKNTYWTSTSKSYSLKNNINFWLNEKGFIVEDKKELFNSSELRIPGLHNTQNLLLVTAVARNIGLDSDSIKKSINSFKGVEHRLEKLGELNGIIFFNDSKATNFDSASMGIKAIQKPTTIIAGGKIKEGDYSSWLNEIKIKSCGIVFFGSGAKDLKALVINSGYNKIIICCNALEQAVDEALKIAIKENSKSLILSPACSSFDQYKDFEERGNHFKKIFESLINRE